MAATRLRFTAIVLGVLVGYGIQNRANAQATSPPAGYPYTARQPMVASNSITFTDVLLTALGYRKGKVSTDALGTAVTISSNSNLFGFLSNRSLNYYFQYPYQTSSGAPDTTFVTFDLKDQTGEYAGLAETYTWVVNGQTWYYDYQEIMARVIMYILARIAAVTLFSRASRRPRQSSARIVVRFWPIGEPISARATSMASERFRPRFVRFCLR